MFYKITINKDLVTNVPDAQKEKALLILFNIQLGIENLDLLNFDDKYDILNILACDGILSRDYDSEKLQLEKNLMIIKQKEVNEDLIEDIRVLWLKKNSGYANISLSKYDTTLLIQRLITENNWKLEDIYQIAINYMSELKVKNVRPKNIMI